MECFCSAAYPNPRAVVKFTADVTNGLAVVFEPASEGYPGALFLGERIYGFYLLSPEVLGQSRSIDLTRASVPPSLTYFAVNLGFESWAVPAFSADLFSDGLSPTGVRGIVYGGASSSYSTYVYLRQLAGTSSEEERFKDFHNDMHKVIALGDIDGDEAGMDDLVVANADGEVRVLFGPFMPPSTDPEPVEINIRGPAEHFGAAMTVGDFDGDGLEDIIVGDRSYNAGESNQGGVFVFWGHAPDSGGRFVSGQTLSPEDADLVLLGSSKDKVGTQLAMLGDVNGDGRQDLGITATIGDLGHVYVVLGRPRASWSISPVTLAPVPISDLSGPQDGIYLLRGPHLSTGESLAAAGDVDGDGFDDFLIGSPAEGWQGDAPEPEDDVNSTGSVHLFFGGQGLEASGTFDMRSTGLRWVTLQGITRNQELSTTVAGGQDLSGDGIPDIALGSNKDTAFLVLSQPSCRVRIE